MTDSSTSYDEIPYTSYAYPMTHPDRLATIGQLFGMVPAKVEHARVLELGCASGGNLIPMAEQLPEGQFVGVDLSARQIAEGQAAIREIGLGNIVLHHADLQRVDATWGQFDYIVCHGVYSWVPPAVQDRILEICQHNLAPNGIAFVSYNTYPGWHLRESVRHMMRFHAAQFADAHERTAQAGALVDFLVTAVEDEDDLHGMLLRREVDLLSRTSPQYLFHEHLEEHNIPCYFHQFAERLPAKGLQYLGEADVHTMFTREHAPEVAETLRRISPNIIALEQYLDFVRNRQFRQTLLCRAEVALERNLRPELVPGFRIAFSASMPAGDLDLAPGIVEAFVVTQGLTVSSAEPVTKAALSLMAEQWPDSFAFADLCDAARDRLAGAGAEVPDPAYCHEMLAVDLMACFVRGGVELRCWRPTACRHAGTHPAVSAYARWQAAHGDFATNRRHVKVELDDPARHVLRLLDGTRDHEALVVALAELVVAGTLSLAHDGERIVDRDAARAPLRAIVENTLADLAACALLIA